MHTVYTSHNNKKGNSRATISDVVSINNPFNIFNQKLKNRVKRYLVRIKVFFDKNAYSFDKNAYSCNKNAYSCNKNAYSCNKNAYSYDKNAYSYDKNAYSYDKNAYSCNKNAYSCTKMRRLIFMILKYCIPKQSQIFKNKDSIYQTILSVFNMRYFIQNTEINLKDLQKCFKKSNTYLSNYETITVIGK